MSRQGRSRKTRRVEQATEEASPSRWSEVLNGKNGKALSALVTFGVKRLLLLVFVILLLVAIEEIAVVIFSRQPAESFTPALIGALTAIVGGLLIFFGKVIRDHRNSDEESSSEE